MSATTTAFVFNKDYNDKEQVRPFMGAYAARLAELEAAGKYPYNDSFKGHIPGIEGESEDAAIYLLQTLHKLDQEAALEADFLASGGEIVTDFSVVRRGTVVHAGFYMGGTGWQEYHDVRLTKYYSSPMVLPKGARTRGQILSGGRVLFKGSEAVAQEN